MFGYHLLLAITLAWSCIAARQRVTFSSSGTSIVGYRYTPSTQSGKVPAVIIAHGLGGLQTSRLQPFAERFAANGYQALTFDYRYWGQSAGQPRNIIDVQSQEDDYRAAIAYLKTLPDVDGSRIVLWGTSLSGGHVLTLGAQIPELAAVIAQAPHVNGPATVSQIPPDTYPGLTAAGIRDSAPDKTNNPLYIPLSNRTGQFGALTQPGAYEGYQFVQPNPPPPGNVFPARFVLQLPFFNPDLVAGASKVPTIIGVGNTDNITPPGPAIELANRMGAELHIYNGGHFSVYPGASNYEAIVADQVAFLKKKVPIAK